VKKGKVKMPILCKEERNAHF